MLGAECCRASRADGRGSVARALTLRVVRSTGGGQVNQLVNRADDRRRQREGRLFAQYDRHARAWSEWDRRAVVDARVLHEIDSVARKDRGERDLDHLVPEQRARAHAAAGTEHRIFKGRAIQPAPALRNELVRLAADLGIEVDEIDEIYSLYLRQQ